MRHLAALTMCLTASFAISTAQAQTVPAPTISQLPSSTPAAGKYSVEDTDLGTLLDDPASKSIVAKYLPEVINSAQIDMARGLTLRQLQSLAGDKVTEETVNKIQADLNKLPAK